MVADLEAQGLLVKVEPYATRLELLRPEQDADRAVPVGPVVRPDGRRPRRHARLRPAGDGRRDLGPGQDPPRALRQELPRLARREARLVHQPAALVGPPHPDLVLRRRAPRPTSNAPSAAAPTSPGARPSRAAGSICAEHDLAADALGPGLDAGRRTPTSSTPGSARPSGRTRPSAGPSRRPSWRSITRRASSPRPATSSRSGSRGW